MVNDKRICEVTLVSAFENVVPRLIEEANRNGGVDNISTIFIQILES